MDDSSAPVDDPRTDGFGAPTADLGESVDAATVPDGAPAPRRLASAFAVFDVRTDGERVVYVGEPLGDPESVVRTLWPTFREAGYEVEMRARPTGHALVATPVSVGLDGVPWTNLLLFLATVVSTLFAGSFWYYVDPIANPGAIWQAWPFTASILFVLGAHEMGHYLASRYYRVQASLPYFLPVPTLIGTMGAVIRMRGRIPDRKALFDIGVAGPLAGLVATVLVTVVGLHMEPVTAPPGLVETAETQLRLGYPPLIEALAAAFDRPLYRESAAVSVNPVVVGAWVGTFVTFLNLIPVGQLDGGHVLRAMLGEYQETVAALVPGALLGLAGYLYYVAGVDAQSVFVWVFWGVVALVVAAAGPVRPVVDDRLGTRRLALGVLTFALGVACFVPVPLELVT